MPANTTTPANASAEYKQEVANLAFGTNIPTIFPVGTLGMTFADAVAAIIALPNPSITGFTGTTNADLTKIIADAGTPLTGLIGRRFYVQIDNAGAPSPMIMGFVLSDTTLIFPYELPKIYTSIVVELFSPPLSIMQFQPGELHTINADTTLPSFTIFDGIHKEACHVESEFGVRLSIPVNANEVHFRNFQLTASQFEPQGTFGERLIEWQSSGANDLAFLTDFNFDNVILNGGHVDTLFQEGGDNSVIGGLKISNSFLGGYFDLFTVKQCRQLVINNSTLLSKSTAPGGIIRDNFAIGVSIGSAQADIKSVYRVQNYQITNNNIICESYLDTKEALGFDITKLAPESNVFIKGNMVRAVSNVGNTDAKGISGDISTLVTGVPGATIMAIDNQFDIQKAGTGVAQDIDSNTANQPIQYRNNYRLDGSPLVIGNNATVLQANET